MGLIKAGELVRHWGRAAFIRWLAVFLLAAWQAKHVLCELQSTRGGALDGSEEWGYTEVREGARLRHQLMELDHVQSDSCKREMYAQKSIPRMGRSVS